ncbi:MAG: hypothetical protein M0Z83_00875 [Betaproteobacteria bacterium]|nr:hypothetical protein [Betaproteobacteria bacterium]
MSRYTGEMEVAAVLEAADAWRANCLLRDGSVFSDEPIWSKSNFDELRRLFEGNPIEGNRDFFDKLKEQIASAPKGVKKLAAEIFWFYLLFPHKSGYNPETKAAQVRDIWGWSEDPIPNDRLLDSPHLVGVGGVGVAYLTRRPDQLWFFLQALSTWKGLTDGQRSDLISNNSPWDFVEWLDAIPNAAHRPIRNALLYFIFPDQIERIVSNDHRRLILAAFKSKLATDSIPKSSNPSLLEMDKAISSIRGKLEAEFGTNKLDFYNSPLQEQWSSVSMQQARRTIAGVIERSIEPYGLELRQCGSKKSNLAGCNKEIDTTTGFWKDPAEATNKPLRWIVHLDITGDSPVARIADKDGVPLHGNRRIAFSNNAQQKSGAITVRIVPAIKISADQFVFHEEWEWLFLLCFFPALPKGSSGQLLDDFNPENGLLIYMGKDQPYVFSALITLNVEDAQFSTVAGDATKKLSYQEATIALTRMIHVRPMFLDEAEAANAE